MNKLPTKISVLCFLLLMLLISPTALAQYQVGDVVSDFSLTSVDLAQISLYDFKGKAILLNFFATW